MSPPLHVFLSAGDVSGDIHAAHLIEALKRHQPDIRISGLAGPASAEAGCELVHNLTDHAVLGFRRAVGALPTFMGFLADGARWMERESPDVCIPIDYPGFNLNLAALAKARGIAVSYYICPQLWAWAPWRIRRFRNRVDQALVIFPFEEDFYRDNGVSAQFIGHPVADNFSRLSPPFLDGTEQDPNLICLLPGSRRQEIQANLPLMLEAAQALQERHPACRFHCPHLNPKRYRLIEELIAKSPLTPSPTIGSDYHESVARARVALVASGTATLEVALLGTPMVVVYRISRVLSLAGPWLLTVPHIAQVNLLGGREIVPEFLGAQISIEAVVNATDDRFMDGPVRERTLRDLSEIRQTIGNGGAAENAANAILNLARLQRNPEDGVA